MTSMSFAQETVRVACVGDSITYGDKLSERELQSYPAVLQRLSQGRLVVGNFGVNATTALKNTGRAWTDTLACRDAIAFKPGIVVVMLGINDLAFPDLVAQYPADLRTIVTRFQSLPSAPHVYLCTLTPIAPEDQQAYANRTIRNSMIPAIRAVAAETKANLIDVHAAFPNRLDLLPDGLHPSPAGAELIACTVFAALDSSLAQPPQIRPAPATGPVGISIRNEALAAKGRAEQWLKTQPPPTELQDPRSRWTGHDLRNPEEIADLLPFLSGPPVANGADPFFSFAALAYALARIGQETLFLADGRPIAWREALLHQLVQLQQMDARGNGFWINPGAEDQASDSVHSTAYALQAIATALGD
jgi:lysophospholipase L1-like esterase